MSKQVTLRLSDDVVAFIDDQVSHGVARSRAAVVNRALHREQRYALAMRDAAILAERGPDADLESLTAAVSSTPLDID